jgi:hypothetical protein
VSSPQTRSKTLTIRRGRAISSALFAILLFALFSLLVVAQSAEKPRHAPAKQFSITHSDFHGWDVVVVRNRSAQLVIVPEIGRIMRFGLIDETGKTVAGPFWNNPDVRKGMPADAEGWKNYGGDKAWPAPQADWPRVAGRGWPPPNGFDATSFTAKITGRQVELVSAVDPIYGIRVRRTIALDSQSALVNIKTVYEKVRGNPVHIAVWTITQLESPDRAFIRLPAHSSFPQGYVNLVPALPNDLRVQGRLLSLARDLETRTKIGSDGISLLWIGAGADLLIEIKNSRPSTGEWPEHGSHTEIYTSPSEQLKYVEFELLGPLQDLRPGQVTSLDACYRLIPRAKLNPNEEAKKVLLGKVSAGAL